MCKNCQNKLVGKAPYRVDHVGSFLRPKELVEARAKFVAGEITQEELTKVEDKTITELVEKQIVNGLKMESFVVHTGILISSGGLME